MRQNASEFAGVSQVFHSKRSFAFPAFRGGIFGFYRAAGGAQQGQAAGGSAAAQAGAGSTGAGWGRAQGRAQTGRRVGGAAGPTWFSFLPTGDDRSLGPPGNFSLCGRKASGGPAGACAPLAPFLAPLFAKRQPPACAWLPAAEPLALAQGHDDAA